jgi:hypothetical protein
MCWWVDFVIMTITLGKVFARPTERREESE